jgi:hypothetical protein
MKALQIQEATQKAIFDERIMAQAEMLLAMSQMNPDRETMTKVIFAYSAALASCVASNVVEVTMDADEFDKMVNEIRELDEISESVFGDN